MIPIWIEKSATDEQFIAEVTRHIKQKHTGMANAAKLDVLMQELYGLTINNAQYANASRQLRRTIEVINQAHDGLIVSDTEHGYWWAASLKDGIEAVDKLTSRAKTIMQNAKTIEANLFAAYGGQISLL